MLYANLYESNMSSYEIASLSKVPLSTPLLNAVINSLNHILSYFLFLCILHLIQLTTILKRISLRTLASFAKHLQSLLERNFPPPVFTCRMSAVSRVSFFAIAGIVASKNTNWNILNDRPLTCLIVLNRFLARIKKSFDIRWGVYTNETSNYNDNSTNVLNWREWPP